MIEFAAITSAITPIIKKYAPVNELDLTKRDFIEAIAERLNTDEYEIKVILDKWREFLHLESIAA
jgi:hypothetical protein